MNNKSKSTLEKFKLELSFKNYSKNTIKIYVHYVSIFLSKFEKDIYHIPLKDVEEFLLNYEYSSISMQNQFISSIKLLYKYIVKRKLKTTHIERPRKEKHLPQIIDNEYLLESINKINNLKHKAIISLGYSVGLRISEVLNLKIENIDSKRMIINIKNSKGNKDRIVPLSGNMLMLLRNYYKKYKPSVYLFNGQNKLKYSRTSCNNLIKKHLGEKYHFHLLRHSCFTELTERGINIRVVQKLAGHKSSKTTEIYTHVSKNVLNSLPLPL